MLEFVLQFRLCSKQLFDMPCGFWGRWLMTVLQLIIHRTTFKPRYENTPVHHDETTIKLSTTDSAISYIAITLLHAAMTPNLLYMKLRHLQLATQFYELVFKFGCL